LKFFEKLYFVVSAGTVLAMAGLIFSSLSGPRGDGASGWWYLITLSCGVVCGCGVIWLGWYWLMLSKQARSVAEHLDRGESLRSESITIRPIEQLLVAFNRRVENAVGHSQELEQQVKDLQVQIQLSKKQKTNTEAIIYGIRDAVIVSDGLDRLVMANEVAGRLLGFDFKQSQYKPLNELVTSGAKQFVDFMCHSRLSKVNHTRREIVLSGDSDSDAGPRTYDCIVSCIYNESGQAGEVVAVMHDITREKEISQMKNDFVSHVSHELKTPLASIMAYSEMLMDGDAADEQTKEEFYSVIQSQATRLNRLIEDILNVSRIESGLVKVTKKPVSLTVLIEEQLGMIKGTAGEKNIEITTQKPIVFDQVYADKDMISQVIVNLLSNAVKYTPSGGSVSVETEVDELQKITRISIIDTGVGIPEEEVGHVFDKFYRVHAKENMKQAKGTGLGLNLVKQIVEKVHGGRVFVKSQVGIGSTFGFELPLATAEVVEV